MSALSFHHVGVGTQDIDASIEVYTALGHSLILRVDDPGINVRIALLSLPGVSYPYVELVAPLGSGGPLTSLIARKALPSPYHTCYAVKDMGAAMTDLRALGFYPLTQPLPAMAFDGALVSFHLHKAVGLVELLEDSSFPDRPSLLRGTGLLPW